MMILSIVKRCAEYFTHFHIGLYRGEKMAYRIVYGPEKKAPENRMRRIRMMTAGFFLLGCILTRLFWPDGLQVMREVLLPGELSVTEQAFSQLVSQLQGGEPVGTAVETFCRYVISHGLGN